MQDVPASELADVKAIAQSAVTEFISSPDVFQFDLFASPAVKQLQSESEHAPLYQLLSIVLAGDVKVAFPLPRKVQGCRGKGGGV